MNSVERIDHKIRKLQKPEVSLISEVEIGEGDILVLAAGFEDRCIEVLSRAIIKNKCNFSLLLIKYLPQVQDNKSDEILELCNANKIKTFEITYDRGNPVGIGDRFLEVALQFKGNIFIDVSGMSRLLIVQLIVSLGQSQRNFSNSFVLYTEAMKYPPTEEAVKEALSRNIDDDFTYRFMFISTGVLGLSIVPELSSVALQGQPVRLVAFPSFNVDQLSVLIGELQPSCLTLLHGLTPAKENHWRMNAIKKLNRIEEGSCDESFNVSTLDYRQTLDCLADIYNKHGSMERIILAPIGSKMQAVAVGIFRTFMSDIQIVYPATRQFAAPKEYTVGVSSVYKLKLDGFSPGLLYAEI